MSSIKLIDSSSLWVIIEHLLEIFRCYKLNRNFIKMSFIDIWTFSMSVNSRKNIKVYPKCTRLYCHNQADKCVHQPSQPSYEGVPPLQCKSIYSYRRVYLEFFCDIFTATASEIENCNLSHTHDFKKCIKISARIHLHAIELSCIYRSHS